MPTEATVLLAMHLVELFPNEQIVEEHRFCERKWRFDFAIPSLMLALEIEGGVWSGGRHTRGKGYQGDLTKYATATSLGWTVFRFSTEDVLQGRDLEHLSRWKSERAARQKQS